VFGGETEFPGVRYVQDGYMFRLDGSLLGDPVEVDAETLTTTKPPKGSVEELQWIRQQLEIYNEPFTNLTQARKFLAGKE
jgi:hypothetical protein